MGNFVKGITIDQERERHKFLLDVYKSSSFPDEILMSRISENKNETLDVLGWYMKTGVSLYSYKDQTSWIAYSIRGMHGFIENKYSHFDYEDISTVKSLKPDVILINETAFWVPDELNDFHLKVISGIKDLAILQRGGV